MTHSYTVTGMTCSGCQATVQKLLSEVKGVKNTSIDLASGETIIEMETHIPTENLQAALKSHPNYKLSEKKISASPVFEKTEKRTWLEIYKPILLIFLYLAVISIITSTSAAQFNLMQAMRIFMSGFFLVFSFFKLLDLKGFASSYAMYDIVAKNFKSWGFIYVFIEAGLGISYALNLNPIITNYVMLLVMTISIIGVIQSVLKKTSIRCACLGAVFNLPMSTVTIIEDGLMILMGIAMLILLRG